MVKKRSTPSISTEKTSKPRAKKAAKPVSAQAAGLLITEDLPVANGALRDEIALLAYSYWEERGCQGGSAEDDWLRAEQVVLSRYGSAVNG